MYNFFVFVSFAFFQLFCFIKVELSWQFCCILFPLCKADMPLVEALIPTEVERPNTTPVPGLKTTNINMWQTRLFITKLSTSPVSIELNESNLLFFAK